MIYLPCMKPDHSSWINISNPFSVSAKMVALLHLLYEGLTDLLWDNHPEQIIWNWFAFCSCLELHYHPSIFVEQITRGTFFYRKPLLFFCSSFYVLISYSCFVCAWMFVSYKVSSFVKHFEFVSVYCINGRYAYCIITSHVLFHDCAFYCPCAVAWTLKVKWVCLWVGVSSRLGQAAGSLSISLNVKLPLVDYCSHSSVIHVYCFLQSWSRKQQSWRAASSLVTTERESRALWELAERRGPDSDQSGHLAEARQCFNWMCCWPQPSKPIQHQTSLM